MMFFFSSRRRHTRSLCDWSSDVCSSDLGDELRDHLVAGLRCGRVDEANDPALVGGGAQEGIAQGGGEGRQSALGGRERTDKTESCAHSSGAFRSGSPGRTENEASRSKILRLTGSVYARPTAAIRLRSWLRPRGVSTRCSNCRPSQAHRKCDDVSLSEDGNGR